MNILLALKDYKLESFNNVTKIINQCYYKRQKFYYKIAQNCTNNIFLSIITPNMNSTLSDNLTFQDIISSEYFYGLFNKFYNFNFMCNMFYISILEINKKKWLYFLSRLFICKIIKSLRILPFDLFIEL